MHIHKYIYLYMHTHRHGLKHEHADKDRHTETDICKHTGTQYINLCTYMEIHILQTCICTYTYKPMYLYENVHIGEIFIHFF